MHIKNLILFQNPAIYYLHHHENDVIIPANLFSDRVQCKDLNSRVYEIYCLISKISIFFCEQLAQETL